MRARNEAEAGARRSDRAVVRPADARPSAVGLNGPLSSAVVQQLQHAAGNATVARMVAARGPHQQGASSGHRPEPATARPAPNGHPGPTGPTGHVVQRAGETPADRGDDGQREGTGRAASGPAGTLSATADHAAVAGAATVGGSFTDPAFSTPTSYATGTGAPFGTALAAGYGAVSGAVSAVGARNARGRAEPGSAEHRAADSDYRTARADAAQNTSQTVGQVHTGAGGAMNQSGNFNPAEYSDPLAAGAGVGVVTGGLQAGRFLRKALRANERAVRLREVIDREESAYEGYKAQVNAAYERVELLREAVASYQDELRLLEEIKRLQAKQQNLGRSSKQRAADLQEELYGGPAAGQAPGSVGDMSPTRRERIGQMLELGAESSSASSSSDSETEAPPPRRAAQPTPAPAPPVEEAIDMAEVNAALQHCQQELVAARKTLADAVNLRQKMKDAVESVIGDMARYANGDSEEVTVRMVQLYAEAKNADGRHMKLATAIAGAMGVSASVASLVATAAVAAGATAGAGVLAATPLGWALAGVAAITGAGIAGRKTLHLFEKRWEQTKPENTGEERLGTWRHLGRTLRFWRPAAPNERREYARVLYEAAMTTQEPDQAERLQNTLDALGITRDRLSDDPEVGIALIARKMAS